jgi:Tol biopolymer transport system component
VSRLYRRPVNGFRSEPIAGADDAQRPFFSPDGEWIAYFTPSREIRKVPAGGGESIVLTTVPFWQSIAFWRRNGTIAVVSDARGIFIAPDHGGPLAPLTSSDSSVVWSTYENSTMNFVRELSDGTLVGGKQNYDSTDNTFVLATLAPNAKQWEAVPGAVPGIYLQSGFLLTRPGTELLATRFDLKRGKATGTPMPVLEGADREIAVNERGDVAYFASPNVPGRLLVLVDRTGTARRVASAAGNYRHPRLSPDGTRLAVNLNRDLWIIDLRTSVRTRLTTNSNITEPQWSADQRRLIHSVFDTTIGYNPPAWRAADGSGAATIIRNDFGDAWTSDWSRDGKYVATYGGKVGQNITVVDFDAPHALHFVTQGEAVSRNARFSPDGRWLAYQSNETGRMQIYVISFPDLQNKQVISTDGGTEPAWRPNGGELYFRNGQSMMAVTVRTGERIEVGTPRELFRGPFTEDLYGDRSYDVMPDGEHFLMFEVNPDATPELRVIRNWAAELKSTVGKK